MALHITVLQGTGGDHFGVEQGVLREQTVEEPTVSVGPIHHRRHTQAMAYMYFFIQTVFQEVSDVSLLAKFITQEQPHPAR
jgi:hypothetical protein